MQNDATILPDLDPKTYVLGAVVVLGLIAGTVGADLAGSERLALGFAVGGFLLAWSTLFLADYLDAFGTSRDERFEAIWYRSGYYGWLFTMAAATTLGSALSHDPALLSAEYTAIAIGATAALAPFAAAFVLGRRM